MRLEKPWVCDTWLSIVQSITARKASVYMLRVIGNKSHCLRAESLLNQLVTKVMTVAPTPAKKVIPHQVLLLCKHGHHDERVQVNAFTEHPEVVTAHQVEMDELRHFTAHLWWGEKWFLVYEIHMRSVCPSLFQKPWVSSFPTTQLCARGCLGRTVLFWTPPRDGPKVINHELYQFIRTMWYSKQFCKVQNLPLLKGVCFSNVFRLLHNEHKLPTHPQLQSLWLWLWLSVRKTLIALSALN